MRRPLHPLFLSLALTAFAISPALAATAYQVRPGDTLYTIAQKAGLSLSQIETANPMPNPDLIYPGQTINLPEASTVQSQTVNPVSPTVSTTDHASFSSSDVKLLSQMIAAEANDQPYQAQVGVGAVIMNRLASPDFPKTIKGIIYQPNQFTSVSNGWFYQAQPTPTSNQAAAAAIAGQNPVGNALYFYEPAGSTSQWIFTRQVLTQIGSMDFSR